MAIQSLKDRLVFTTDSGESILPPECALIVLTSTLATPITFVVHHFLQELLKSPKNEGAVFLSFLNGGGRLVSNMKKLVIAIHTYDLCCRELMWFKLNNNTDLSVSTDFHSSSSQFRISRVHRTPAK